MSESPSPELIQALADAVSLWRTQEYTTISFYCFYVYYVLTTLREEVNAILKQSYERLSFYEVSVIWPQKWNRGKTLYMLIRYGVLVYISMALSRDYRTYFVISPEACKALSITLQAIFYVIILTCDFSLALCLGALLQAKVISLVSIVALACALPFVYAILNLVGGFQLPVQPISALDIELGYACYYYTYEELFEETIMYLGLNVRSYLNLVATTLLAVLGVVTLFVRYKGHGGGLIRVIRRDGGIHYLSLLALRLLSVIIATRALFPSEELDSSPAPYVFNTANEIIVPILAQRLLINMRKVDFIGSQPVASKLLFASMVFEKSKDNTEGIEDSFEGRDASSHQRHEEGEAVETISGALCTESEKSPA